MNIALSPPTGRVVPDKNHPGMWRSVKVDGILSDTANRERSWSEWSGLSCSTYSEGKIVDAEALLAENDRLKAGIEARDAEIARLRWALETWSLHVDC